MPLHIIRNDIPQMAVDGLEKGGKVMPKVVALGELLIDFSTVETNPDGYPTMAAHPGGAPANYLAAVAAAGSTAALLAKVGDDAFGGLLVHSLKKAGVETRGICVDPAVFTTLAFVTLDERGERSFSFARKPGADTWLRWEEVDTALIDEAAVLHFGSLSLTDEPARTATRKAVAYARARGKWISFDPNLRRPLWKSEGDAREQMLWGLRQADVVKISDEEVAFLWGLSPAEGAARIRNECGAKLVFVTGGAAGCYFENAIASGQVSTPAGIRPTDTTGAGDIFGGSAMARLLRTGQSPDALTEPELRDIVRFACTAASLSTERPGGISSVPPCDEVERRMET